jgi:uncharacterized protein YukE
MIYSSCEFTKMKGCDMPRPIIHMSADEVGAFLGKLATVQASHEQSIQQMRQMMDQLMSSYTADSADAYNECFTAMSRTFAMYTELIQDYSSTLQRVKDNTFTNDQAHAAEIRSRFSR